MSSWGWRAVARACRWQYTPPLPTTSAHEGTIVVGGRVAGELRRVAGELRRVAGDLYSCYYKYICLCMDKLHGFMTKFR